MNGRSILNHLDLHLRVVQEMCMKNKMAKVNIFIMKIVIVLDRSLMIGLKETFLKP